MNTLPGMVERLRSGRQAERFMALQTCPHLQKSYDLVGRWLVTA
jgi:hypothetical protein